MMTDYDMTGKFDFDMPGSLGIFPGAQPTEQPRRVPGGG